MKRLALPVAPAVALAVPAVALAHGGGVSPDGLPSAWEAPPAIVAGAIVALALFFQGWLRLRGRGRRDLAPWTRAALFVAAVALGTLALVSPLDAVGEEYLLVFHMLQHVLIMDVVPMLTVLALRGPLCFFFLPAPVLSRLAKVRPLTATLHFLLRPAVSFVLWVVVLTAWHLPPAYEATLSNTTVHDLEHLSFLVAGLLAWSQLVDPARRRALTVPGRITFAVGMFVFASPVAQTMAFASPLYSSYRDQTVRLLGLTPQADQHWAAVLMIGEQLLLLGTFCLILFWPHFSTRPAEDRGAEAPAR